MKSLYDSQLRRGDKLLIFFAKSVGCSPRTTPYRLGEAFPEVAAPWLASMGHALSADIIREINRGIDASKSSK